MERQRWTDKLDENFGAVLMVSITVCFLVFLGYTLPNTLDGMDYFDAIKDALGLRVTKLALFDFHAIAVLHFAGGRNWNITQMLKTKPVSTAILLAAVFIGSAMMLM